MYSIPPHKIQDTMGVARAHTIIQCIIGPLTTVMSLIAKGSTPEYKQQVINSLIGSGVLNRPDVEAENLKAPRMICTHKECIRFRTDPRTGKKVYDFSNPCHEECLLKNVAKASPGDIALTECRIFNIKNICRKCNHSYKFHMHVPFQVIQIMSQVESGKKLNRRDAEKRYEKFYRSLNDEKVTIMRSIVILSTFLRENTIIEYNSAFKDRVEVEMRIEQAKGNKDSVSELNGILNDYDAKVGIINSTRSTQTKTVKLNQISETLEMLFKLPLYGKTIHSLFQKELPPSEAANAQDFIHCDARYVPAFSF